MPYLHWYVAGFLFLTLTNWLAVQVPLQLSVAVDALQTDVGAVKRAAYMIAIFGGATIFARTLSRLLFFTPGRLLEHRLRADLLAHLLKLQPRFYSEFQTGDIVSRSSNDMTHLRAMIGFGGLQIINVTLAVILSGQAMWSISPKLTWYTLLPIFLALAFVQPGIQKFYSLFKTIQKQLADLSDHIFSTLSGMQTVQGFNAQEAMLGRFNDKNVRYYRSQITAAKIRAFVIPLLPMGGGLAVFGLILQGGAMVQSGVISVGDLVAFITYVGLLVVPLRSLGWLISVMQRGYVSLTRLNEIMDSQPDRPEGDNPVDMEHGSPPSIEVKSLSFAYSATDKVDDNNLEPDKRLFALKDVSFKIKSGEVVGLFGRTGSGKTTLLRVLSRLWNPDDGTVLINGVDINHIDLYKWRKQLSYVRQRPYLFSRSIAENISMAPITNDDEAKLVESSAKSASLGPDLCVLHDGIDTTVGERGIMLSGGQRQRVSLARGLHRSYDLLLLDDVISAVDHETERHLIKTIRAASTSTGSKSQTQPTTIIVSHRISALAHADQILVLDNGRLVATGDHETLSTIEGPYREALLHQQGRSDSEE
jgi:ATP-binding cassette, subfamily B, multidrug efflux pump